MIRTQLRRRPRRPKSMCLIRTEISVRLGSPTKARSIGGRPIVQLPGEVLQVVGETQQTRLSRIEREEYDCVEQLMTLRRHIGERATKL